MDTVQQGVNVVPASADPNAGQGANGNGTASATQTQVPDGNATSTTDPNLAQQGATQQQPNNGFAEIQSLADRRQAENLALQQQLFQMQQQMAELAQRQVQAQPQQQANPYDPQTQANEWWAFHLNQRDQMLSQNLITQMRQIQREDLKALVSEASEQSWQQQHPNVDVRNIKLQIQARYGIQNPPLSMIDDYNRMINAPQAQFQAQQQAINSTFQQLRQTTSSPSTVRGGAAAGGTAVPNQGSYEQDAVAFQESNGRVYQSWSPERQREFDRETYRRDSVAREAARTRR